MNCEDTMPSEATTALVPRATVQDLVDRRDRALKSYDHAHAALVVASEYIEEARNLSTVGAQTRYNYHINTEKMAFLGEVRVPDRDAYLGMARRVVDTDAWSTLIGLTDLERLMDKTAKDQFHQQLIKDPPEVTVENVYATLEGLVLDAENIFRRGIAECFSNLDRRFKSHDGWKIGSRVILDGCFDGWGYWSHYRNHRDTLMDVERVFLVLDGQPLPSYSAVVQAIEEIRKGFSGQRQSEVETDLFKIRCYKNGNCHIWFKRDDLVEKVNRLLADYYGAALSKGEVDVQAEDKGRAPKTSLAKNCGFYPTPSKLARLVIDHARLWTRAGDPPLTVLEPSAGTGNLAAPAVELGCHVDCVEVQPLLAYQLRSTGKYRDVVPCDFLAMSPDPEHPEHLYDRVIMNPPFDMERDIDHVLHATKFLKPGGYMTAIMSAGTEFRQTKKARAFRAMVERLGGKWWDLPAGSFSECGTNVNTVLVSFYTPEYKS